MKYYKKFTKAFGVNEFGLIDFPSKFSNVKISRIENANKRGGCTWCFPHGIETTNSKYDKFTRNWKAYRKTQWKVDFEKKENINIIGENSYSVINTFSHTGYSIDEKYIIFEFTDFFLDKLV